MCAPLKLYSFRHSLDFDGTLYRQALVLPSASHGLSGGTVEATRLDLSQTQASIAHLPRSPFSDSCAVIAQAWDMLAANRWPEAHIQELLSPKLVAAISSVMQDAGHNDSACVSVVGGCTAANLFPAHAIDKSWMPDFMTRDSDMQPKSEAPDCKQQ